MTGQDKSGLYESFFTGRAWEFLLRGIDLTLEEDGADLTSRAAFSASDRMSAVMVAGEPTLVAGLPLMETIMQRLPEAGRVEVDILVPEGSRVREGERVCYLRGCASSILKAERVLLNYIAHLSGIAERTSQFARRVQGTGTILLDTRKTLPGLRYPEKYAVRVGGGHNHRLDLEEMLMLKDNHIDRAGGITRAVSLLRSAYSPCPPIIVECRDLAEVEEAVESEADRVLLDNMDPESISLALQKVPAAVETEISGGVDLERVGELAALGADYISAGTLTHSARCMDFSLDCEVSSTGRG